MHVTALAAAAAFALLVSIVLAVTAPNSAGQVPRDDSHNLKPWV